MKPKIRLLELDCLRGIAILLVVLCHFTLGNNLLERYFKFGATGVELFFMISGFVIFLTVDNSPNLHHFLIARFARLYPAYWASVTLTAIALIAHNHLTHQSTAFPSWKDYLVNLSMFQDFFKVARIDSVYWSLTIELMFYFFISVLLIGKQLKRIELIGCIVVILCFINQIFFRYKVPALYNFLSNYYSIVYTFPLFVAGIMFYKMKFERPTIARIILICLCYVVQICLWEPTGGHAVETRPQYGLILFVYFALFALYQFNFLKFIVNKILLFVGRVSYSLYLTHTVIFVSIILPVLTRSKKVHINFYIASFLICLPLAILLAYLINRFVENPARKKLKSTL